jgi:poly-gamma-glutamate synthesis protein (capsule biosynthesis protein)
LKNPRLLNYVIKLLSIILIILVVICLCYLFLWYHQSNQASNTSPAIPQPALFLESFFRSQAVYEDAFVAVGPVRKVKVRAGIVTHHFLARRLMAEFFAGIDPDQVQRVILAGPDHYQRLAGGPPLFAASLLPWKTPYGFLAPDGPFIQGLLASGDGALNDGIFRQEHAVYTLIPFVKRTFPQARLIPLVLRSSRDYGSFLRLGARLAQAADRDTVFLLSSDFAHGVNAGEARRQDEESLAHLQDLRPQNLGKIHADCRAGLATLAGFLGDGPRNFVLVNHKTAADFGSREPDNLTSYLTGYYLKRPKKPLSLLFLGDLMFDRRIRTMAQERGNDYLFQGLSELLQGQDLVIANLEGPLTGRPSVSLGSRRRQKNHYVFNFDPGLARTLKKQHLTLVHLGNNHILDFGREGLEETRRHLELAGIDYFGDPLAAEKRWLIKEVASIRLAFISYNQFVGHGVEKTLADLKHARPRAQLVVVYAHWGGEFRREPGERLRRLAHLFIEAGADLIIGSHSHTVQPREAYRGKMIYYSLGNFIFDQYGQPETRRGLAVKVNLDPADLKMEFVEIPLSLENNGQTHLESNRMNKF